MGAYDKDSKILQESFKILNILKYQFSTLLGWHILDLSELTIGTRVGLTRKILDMANIYQTFVEGASINRTPLFIG